MSGRIPTDAEARVLGICLEATDFESDIFEYVDEAVWDALFAEGWVQQSGVADYGDQWEETTTATGRLALARYLTQRGDGADA